MPTTYKGATIPLSSDLADGPQAFKDYTDSLPAADAVLAGAVPPGTVAFTCRTTAPDANWLMLIGQTIAAGATAYPKLWAAVPASWQSGTNLVLPDCRGRIVIGIDPSKPAYDVPGELAGAETAALAAGHLPPHTHTQQGAFNTAGASVRHVHGAAGGGQHVETYFGTAIGLPGGAGGRAADFTNTDTPDHVHGFNLSGETANGPGASTPFSILPPVVAFNAMIRAN